MKTCIKCNIEKEIIEFSKDASKKDGHSIYCKICLKQYRHNNKHAIKRNNKKYKSNNVEKIKISNKQYKIKNKEQVKESSKKYYLDNLDKIKKYRNNNSNKTKEYLKEYTIRNRDKNNKNRNDRKKTNPLFKLACNTRSLISTCIKKQNYTKKSKTYEILGCTFEEFKQHLESQFTEGMTWDNQGKWHLDHVYPVSRAVDEQHLIKLNHYTNFQPLWAKDNFKKSNKII